MIEKYEIEKLQKAVVFLAQHIERCPYNDMYVIKEVLEILELEVAVDPLLPKE